MAGRYSLSSRPLGLGFQRSVAGTALARVLQAGEEKGVSVQPDSWLHQQPNASVPLSHIHNSDRPGDKVSMLRTWWALLIYPGSHLAVFLGPPQSTSHPKLLTLLLPGCSSL